MMKLKNLIDSIGAEVIMAGGDADVEIGSIAFDSRDVNREGKTLFAALPGEHVDGHRFVKNAVDNGAVAVLAQRPAKGVTVPQIIARDSRAALSRISDRFYGEPSKGLIMAGVTGTNGKTTTTYLLESIFAEAGFSPGVIGTVNYRYGGKVFPAPHTTPEAPELHRILKEMSDAGVTHCVMEVSSHALHQKRAADVRLNAGVFTNLTHDHLDYHKTMEDYFEAKKVLFKELLRVKHGAAIINADSVWGRTLLKEVAEAVPFGLVKCAGVYPKEYKLTSGGIEALVATPQWTLKISSNLVGEYNLQNILGAIAAAYSLGIEPLSIEKGINALKNVPGRLEKFAVNGSRGFTAYVDYAHTDDALRRALMALKNVTTGRIITVFGCGGNRDRLKRPKMGMVSAELSSLSIITSDNPRDEDPLEIIREIEAGMSGARKYSADANPDGRGYMVIPERAEAIKKAVSLAKKGDVILVAGKGHEDYQIVKGVRAHFSDFEELRGAAGVGQ